MWNSMCSKNLPSGVSMRCTSKFAGDSALSEVKKILMSAVEL